jgi:hypothetical protein
MTFVHGSKIPSTPKSSLKVSIVKMSWLFYLKWEKTPLYRSLALALSVHVGIHDPLCQMIFQELIVGPYTWQDFLWYYRGWVKIHNGFYRRAVRIHHLNVRRLRLVFLDRCEFLICNLSWNVWAEKRLSPTSPSNASNRVTSEALKP